ncbi:MAG: hypothetical protein FJY82_11980 [Candidatus Aminicenantes bacterium]|nr:hypothetical protein [Candidatus Aminicenantes bacterium]
MSLNDWLRNAWLVEHKTSPEEIDELLGIADRDMKECQTTGLCQDWRLAIAYNAALQSATAALAASGYRAAREGHHYRIIQSLAFTIGADMDLIAKFDGFRKKRNISDYERSGSISVQEAGEMFVLARTLRKAVAQWLKKNHPRLLKK